MTGKFSELQQLKGIGEILARRLGEAGLDSFARIAAAGEVGLRAIKGINPRAVPAIIEQARRLAETAAAERTARSDELKHQIVGLRGSLQALAAIVQKRYPEELADKSGRTITKELVRAFDLLGDIERKLPKRLKRAGKGLAKAGRSLAGLAEAAPKGVRKGLRRTRQALQGVLA